MGRRTVLLIVAALVAVLGSGMVFLYVKGADDRAIQGQEPMDVLKAVAQIEPGETLAQAQSSGKIQLQKVPKAQVIPGAVSSTGDMTGEVALTTIFPNEQITQTKFGSPGEQDVLNIPEGNFAISVNLSDTGRVAGFVSPGSDVAIFVTGAVADGVDSSRLLLPKVKVIAVGQTTVTTSTTTTTGGAQTTESLPRTLFTLSVDQKQAEKVLFASTHGELSFGLLTDKSRVRPDGGTNAGNLFR